MSDKKIPVYVGNILVGRASMETTADGTNIVNISMDNPDWGGWSVGGFAPLRITGIIPVNHWKGKD